MRNDKATQSHRPAYMQLQRLHSLLVRELAGVTMHPLWD